MNLKEKKTPRVYELSQFTAIDSRLMVKTDLTHSQKSILSYMMSMLNYNEKFQATNKRLKVELNVSPSTASSAFLLFEERGWITMDYFDGDLRSITCTEDNIQNFNQYLGRIEEYEAYVKESMTKKIKQRAPIQSKRVTEFPGQFNEKEPEAVQTTPHPETTAMAPAEVRETIEQPRKDSDLSALLVDTNLGVPIDEDEEFKREMELQWQRMEENKMKTTETFDALKWLKSFMGSIGNEHNDETYEDLIREVNKYYNYKPQITMDNYLSYFKWGNNKEPHTEFLGHQIYEAHKRNKRTQFN